MALLVGVGLFGAGAATVGFFAGLSPSFLAVAEGLGAEFSPVRGVLASAAGLVVLLDLAGLGEADASVRVVLTEVLGLGAAAGTGVSAADARAFFAGAGTLPASAGGLLATGFDLADWLDRDGAARGLIRGAGASASSSR